VRNVALAAPFFEPYPQLRVDAQLAHDLNNLHSVQAIGLAERLAQAAGDPAQVTDVGATLRAAQPLLRRAVGERVDLAIEPGDSPARVLIAPVGIERILLNLLVNAREALGVQGGAVRVAVAHGDGVVRVVVADDGPGMEQDVLRRACEPRFSTKAPGHAAGLGLASVARLAESAGGSVGLESRPGDGTVVTVRLPALRGARVLVVEDQTVIARHACEVLDRAGYDVVQAGDAATALGALDGADLILTDVTMPGTSGPDLAREATARAPELRVIFMSGYPKEAAGSEGEASFLPKPFSDAALLEAVGGALLSACGETRRA
jgi:two-component system, cell cycle sensor histidine kinase and response regulator CckA